MRIGMILDNVYPPDPRVENEAIELIKEGHEVYLFCLSYDKNEKVEEEINGIKVRRYTSNTIEYKLSALAYTFPFYNILMSSKIKDFIKNTSVEVIHIHDIRIAGAAFLANKKFNLPTVLDLHENRPEIMRFYPHMQKLYGKLLISIKKWIKKEEAFVKNASKVIVVTKHAKKELVDRTQILKSKVAVVPNTIRSSFYNDKNDLEIPYKNQKEDLTLLYLGDTGERRGLRTVVSSLVKLRDEKGIKNIKFVIVGKTSQYLEKMVSDNSISDQVKLFGWQYDTTFPNWIRESDVCVSPLHKNIHHDTTYANKIFQYMSIGKPLLISDVLAQEVLMKETEAGLVHKAKDVHDFTEQLLKLYHDSNLREKLGKNGESFVRNHFTWDKTSGELIDLYKNLN
ncbi:glycosyltransferase family 4 protein [uncultured Tenacibaculum sp.]|uniref:glycosyltransferase family 4 protein n=1 Tax=uncultured Tenacibaculum sp. TaxID=174713 RepID=UPI00262FC44F|nr:glycosyltransferase family 4 protein [uncultured Tenacibaculum sp.]